MHIVFENDTPIVFLEEGRRFECTRFSRGSNSHWADWVFFDDGVGQLGIPLRDLMAVLRNHMNDRAQSGQSVAGLIERVVKPLGTCPFLSPVGYRGECEFEGSCPLQTAGAYRPGCDL